MTSSSALARFRDLMANWSVRLLGCWHGGSGLLESAQAAHPRLANHDFSM